MTKFTKKQLSENEPENEPNTPLFPHLMLAFLRQRDAFLIDDNPRSIQGSEARAGCVSDGVDLR